MPPPRAFLPTQPLSWTACAIAQSTQRGNLLAGAGANLRGHPSEAYKRAGRLQLYREAKRFYPVPKGRKTPSPSLIPHPKLLAIHDHPLFSLLNTPDKQPVAVSLVIPIYNEEEALPVLFCRLEGVLKHSLARFGRCEVVLINDGSADKSWTLIEEQCRKHPAFVGLRLSRNFGHQLAMTAGLEAARGEVAITLDADLQDPPELIAQMIDVHREGYDVVHATRRTRGEEDPIKRHTAFLFYKIIGYVSHISIAPNTGDFRLLSRRVLDHLAKMGEMHRFLRGLIPWIGFPQTQIFYDRASRSAGETHYPFHRMLFLAFDGITSMSTAPLRLAYGVAVLLFVFFLGYVGYVTIHHFGWGAPLVPGWTSLMCSITLFGTIQLILVGIMGEYVGRIYEQVKQRPLYVVQEICRTDAVHE